LNCTPGWAARLAAWILPMRPAPNNATSIIMFSWGVDFFDVELWLYASAMNSAWHRQMVLVSERKAKALPSVTVSSASAARASGASCCR
jgi:hypothetical protein